MKKNEDTYQTKDLYEASFLYAIKKELTELRREGKFYWFIFKGKDSCEKLSNSYWAGNETVNAKKYSDAVRTLKDRIFAQK